MMATLAISKINIIIELRTQKNERATMGVGRGGGGLSLLWSCKTFFETINNVLANV